FDQQAAELEGAAVPGFFATPQTSKQPESFSSLNQRFGRILAIADSADVAPSATTLSVARELESALKENVARWNRLRDEQLAVLNQLLDKERLTKIDAEKKGGATISSDDDGDDEP